MARCAEAEPALAEVEPGYHVACYLAHNISVEDVREGAELETSAAGGGHEYSRGEGDKL
jgi:hypothetical protein